MPRGDHLVEVAGDGPSAYSVTGGAERGVGCVDEGVGGPTDEADSVTGGVGHNAVIFLSANLRARFHTIAVEFDEFDDLVRKHEERFVSEFVPSEDGDPALTVEEKALVLLYSAVARARVLAWTIAHCINEHLSAGAYLALRAHYEMTALLAYVLRETRKWRTGQISTESFEGTIVRLILATRTPTQNDAPVPEYAKAINVLTMLPAVDLIYNDDRLHGKFKEAYEWLSEFCHPNMFSHEITGRRKEGRRLVFAQRPEFTETDLSHVIGYANLGLSQFLDCYDFLDDAINAA